MIYVTVSDGFMDNKCKVFDIIRVSVVAVCELEWLVLVEQHTGVFSVESDVNVIECIY